MQDLRKSPLAAAVLLLTLGGVAAAGDERPAPSAEVQHCMTEAAARNQLIYEHALNASGPTQPAIGTAKPTALNIAAAQRIARLSCELNPKFYETIVYQPISSNEQLAALPAR